MKYLLTLITVLLISSGINAQDFKLNTVLGQGIIINSNQDVTLFNTTIAVVPSFSLESFRVSGITQSYISETETNYFAGTDLSYRIAQSDMNYYLGVTGLLGNEGKQYLGGSFTVETDHLVSVSLTAGNEFKEKEFYGSLNLGLMIAD